MVNRIIGLIMFLVWSIFTLVFCILVLPMAIINEYHGDAWMDIGKSILKTMESK